MANSAVFIVGGEERSGWIVSGLQHRTPSVTAVIVLPKGRSHHVHLQLRSPTGLGLVPKSSALPPGRPFLTGGSPWSRLPRTLQDPVPSRRLADPDPRTVFSCCLGFARAAPSVQNLSSPLVLSLANSYCKAPDGDCTIAALRRGVPLYYYFVSPGSSWD